MKIATVLSVSALFSLVSLVAAVGCSAPPPAGADGKREQASEQNGGKDEGKATPNKATTPTGSATTPTPAGSPAACLACVGPTSKAGTALKCEEACKDGECADKCIADSCGADGAACKSDFDKCKTHCTDGDDGESGETGTPAQTAKFDQCISANPKAKAYVACNTKCETDSKDEASYMACEEKCWTDSGCEADQTCEPALKKCSEEAGGAE